VGSVRPLFAVAVAGSVVLSFTLSLALAFTVALASLG